MDGASYWLGSLLIQHFVPRGNGRDTDDPCGRGWGELSSLLAQLNVICSTRAWTGRLCLVERSELQGKETMSSRKLHRVEPTPLERPRSLTCEEKLQRLGWALMFKRAATWILDAQEFHVSESFRGASPKLLKVYAEHADTSWRILVDLAQSLLKETNHEE